MGRLLTKLAETSETQIAVVMLVMNLEKIRKFFFREALNMWELDWNEDGERRGEQVALSEDGGIRS
jgi:hypothetical protein